MDKHILRKVKTFDRFCEVIVSMPKAYVVYDTFSHTLYAKTDKGVCIYILVDSTDIMINDVKRMLNSAQIYSYTVTSDVTLSDLDNIC